MNYIFLPTSNGVIGYHKKRKVICFVDENGKKKIEISNYKSGNMLRIPIIRGIYFFVFGIFAMIKGLCFGVTDKVMSNKNKTKTVIGICLSLLCAILVSVLLLGYLPARLSFVFVGYEKNYFLRNLVIALTKVACIFLLLFVFRFLPAMQEFFKFNGACNQVLKNNGEVLEKKRFDCHLPLNFLNFLLFTFLLSVFMITLIGIQISVVLNIAINLGIFIGIIAISYEILWLLTKSEKLSKLCVITSVFIAIRPSLTQSEVVRMTYLELNLRYTGEKVKQDISMAQVLTEMQTRLSKVNKYEKSDVDWIIATVLKKNRAEAKLVRSVDEKTYKEIMKCTDERAYGKPLSCIFGFVDFYGLRFNVNKKVLAPRMETELLVERVIELSSEYKKCEILDIGTGSGAISISVAKNSKAKVCAVDISKGALEVAKENAKQNNANVEFIESDLFKGLKRGRKFDIIVSNPPYIRSLDIEGLDEEVKNYDPKLALDGGEDGLDFYRKISLEAVNHLNKNGKILYEIGKGQYVAVKKILEKSGFENIRGIKDYNKIYRIVEADYGNGR